MLDLVLGSSRRPRLTLSTLLRERSRSGRISRRAAGAAFAGGSSLEIDEDVVALLQVEVLRVLVMETSRGSIAAPKRGTLCSAAALATAGTRPRSMGGAGTGEGAGTAI